MLNHDKKSGKIISTHGYVRRKKDGMVLKCPVYISKKEKPEDYEEYLGSKQTEF